VVAAADADAGPRVESVVYRRWAKFKPGTVVEYSGSSEQPGKAKEEQTTTYTIKAVADDKVTVGVVVAFREPNSQTVANPSQDFIYPRWVRTMAGRPAAADGQPAGATGPEEVTETVAGKAYKARLYRSKGAVEAGPTSTDTYLSDEVPGGLLKSVTTVIPIQRVTITVVTRISPAD
jgi:hypothetical protein